MKLLISCPSFSLEHGGPAYSVSSLARELQIAGEKVTIWSGDKGDADSPFLKEIDPVRISRAPIEQLFAEGGFDLVHDNGIWLPVNHEIARAARKRKIRRIVSTRGMLTPWAMANNGFKKKLAWWLYQRRDLQYADVLHATSAEEKQELEDLGLTAPIAIAPNGVEIPDMDTEIASNQMMPPGPSAKTAICLGRIHPKKGLPLLIAAWAELKPNKWTLKIIGPDEGGHLAELKQLVNEKNVGDTVSFSGPVLGEEKELQFRNADLFILPSYSENFGNVIAEALSYGVPVITTTGTPWSKLVPWNAGWYVRPDVESIQNALLEACSVEPKTLHEMGKNGRREMIANFSWKAVSNELRAVYHRGRRRRRISLIILGLNAFHGDSSACLVKDGKLVAAAEEERFRRIKHWAGFPSESIRYCLAEAGVDLSDVSAVAVNQDSSAHLSQKIKYLIGQRPKLSLVLDRFRNRSARNNLGELLSKEFGEGKFSGEIVNVEHHLCHLSSAFHVSPFEEASVVSVDGFGDFSSGAWAYGNGTDIRVDGRVYFPHSLGIFYQAMTQYLGFPHYGDEYKVMGLAPYGEPEHLDKMREIVKLQPDGSYELELSFFKHHKEGVDYQWKDGVPAVGALYSDKMVDFLGPVRKKDEPLEQYHRDLARSVQRMYEEAFFHLLDKLSDEHNSDNITIAGGCGMNSVANGKVRRQSKFKNVYVQSAAGDAGGAIGAAFAHWHQIGNDRTFHMSHAYWGPSASDDDVSDLLESRKTEIDEKKCKVTKVDDIETIYRRTVDALTDGKVIGWFQGRMEWGPRALGNRSILGDPRRDDMKDILNLKIKRRESFRPFAPSILKEEVDSWFEEEDDVPFMMQVFQIREEKRADIPAVTHVDGSGRLQTVHQDTNPRYHALISRFFEKTGVPMVLNTSFNENEPVVCEPDEALDCFLRTNMDFLVLNDWIVERAEAA